jgi:hypothetical protein
MERVSVEPRMLRWARERAGRSVDSLRKRFPRVELWARREARPTLKQLESFAKATHTPIGYLFLPEPPEERVPIPDLRTVRNERVGPWAALRVPGTSLGACEEGQASHGGR